LENNHENLEEQEDNPFEYFLQSTTWAIIITYHTTLHAKPCHLVFGREMIHNIAFRANRDKIQKIKQDIINKSNQKENKNKSRIPYEYKVGDSVIRNTRDSPEIVNTSYRNISCNKCK
jgi:hypothetical protein